MGNITNNTVREISKDVSILYVEDDMLLLAQLNIFLNKYFYNVDIADNAEAALILYKKNKYDLIITDLKLPKMNGIEFIKQVKKINPRQHIIVASVVESVTVLKALINLGVQSFIPKPFEFKHLFLVIYKEVSHIHHKKVENFYREKANKFSQLYQEVVDQLKFGIVLMELKKIILVNREFLNITGFNSLEKFNDTLKNLTEIFANKDLKQHDNESFIDLLMEKRFLEVTVVNRHTKEKHKLIAEITQLSDINKFLITFLNVQFLQNHINKLQSSLLKSDYSGLPNKLAFKEKLKTFQNQKTELCISLFSLKNFKSLKLYLGPNNAKDILLKIINEIINMLKKANIYKDVFIFDFGINQILFVSDEHNLNVIKKFFTEMEKKPFCHSVEKNNEIKKVEVPVKINFHTINLDKEASSGEIISELTDIFFEFSEK